MSPKVSFPHKTGNVGFIWKEFYKKELICLPFLGKNLFRPAHFMYVIFSDTHGVGGGSLVVKPCPTLATPWTVAHQAPLPMGFPRQKYCGGLPFPSPWDPPDLGIEPRSPALQADSLLTEPLCHL